MHKIILLHHLKIIENIDIQSIDLNNPLFIIVLILFLLNIFEIFFGKAPYIQVDNEKYLIGRIFFKKTETILIKDLKEIRCRQNNYSFIGKNGEIIEIPIGILSCKDVQNFKNEVNTIVNNNSLVYMDF